MFSKLQELFNSGLVGSAEFESRLADAQLLLEYGFARLRFQADHGLQGGHEHPACARSWDNTTAIALQHDHRFFLSKFDMCLLGLVDPMGLPTRKRTAVLNSSSRLHQRLHGNFCNKRTCNHDPCDHVELWGSVNGTKRSEFAQAYTDQFCDVVLHAVACDLFSD